MKKTIWFILLLFLALPLFSQDSLLDLCQYQTKIELVQKAIDIGENVNAVNAYGFTPLMIAAMNSNSPELLALLLDNGADINAQSHLGFTPIMLAVLYTSNTEVIEMILSYDPDLTLRNKNDLTVFDYLDYNYIRNNNMIINKESLKEVFEAYSGE